MIYLFTDFSYAGPYVGELKSVLQKKQTGHEIIDLMHDAPAFNAKASAYLLAAVSRQFKKNDACLAIIDPGVGDTDRRPIIVNADGVTYCGPDNGLFSQIIQQAKNVEVFDIRWHPKKLSNSFHGRDLFAPALAKYLLNDDLALKPVSLNKLVGRDWPNSLNEVIYIDHYGNCITGIPAEIIKKSQTIHFHNYSLNYARTFSKLDKGQAFWYINSMGLVEISINQGHAAEFFKIHVGSELTVG